MQAREDGEGNHLIPLEVGGWDVKDQRILRLPQLKELHEDNTKWWHLSQFACKYKGTEVLESVRANWVGHTLHQTQTSSIRGCRGKETLLHLGDPHPHSLVNTVELPVFNSVKSGYVEANSGYLWEGRRLPLQFFSIRVTIIMADLPLTDASQRM